MKLVLTLSIDGHPLRFECDHPRGEALFHLEGMIGDVQEAAREHVQQQHSRVQELLLATNEAIALLR